MKGLKEKLFGALIALIVTIVGGLAVYFITQRDSRPLVEKLVYALDRPTVFETERTKLSFATLRVGNFGDAAAASVIVAVNWGKGVKIVDKSVTISSGPAGAYELAERSESVTEIRVSSLTPDETLVASFVLDGAVRDAPVVGVKSARSTGNVGVLARTTESRGISFEFWVLMVGGLALLGLVLFFLYWRTQVPRFRSINNTAFLHLHQGLVDAATKMLGASLERDGGGSHAIANYGLCVGLNGDREGAKKRFEAALFYSRSNHERALVAFNRSLVDLKHGDVDTGLSNLNKAMELNKKTIVEYCKYSVIVKEFRANNPKLEHFLASRINV